MAYFSVMMHGEGISVPSSEVGNEITGFYTTQWIKAATSEEAASAATKLVMTDWTEGEYAAVNRGDPPEISVESIAQVGLLKFIWRRSSGGHTFYTSE
jgi:hypothetical protein